MLELTNHLVSYSLWLLKQMPLDGDSRALIESFWMMQCPHCGRVAFKEERYVERYAGHFNDHSIPYDSKNAVCLEDPRLCIECGLRNAANAMVNEMILHQHAHPSMHSYGMILFHIKSIDELLSMRYLEGKNMFELDDFLDEEIDRFWFVSGILKPGCETMLRLVSDEQLGTGVFTGLVTLDLTMVRLMY